MKATLEFTLPEEREEYEQATSAHKYLAVLLGLAEWLRSELKYQERDEHFRTAMIYVRDKLYQLAADEGAEFYK